MKFFIDQKKKNLDVSSILNFSSLLQIKNATEGSKQAILDAKYNIPDWKIKWNGVESCYTISDFFLSAPY